MRTLIRLPFILAFCLFSLCAAAQDSQDSQEDPEQLNLPGDNLNLYAVMKLFQESPTLEDFEKKLNDKSSMINNLDLDGNGQIDYIKVVDHVDGDTHNITLKVAVSQNEDQDVAVFVVHKGGAGEVQIQLIGDENLYGKDYIIEPDSEAPTATPNPGYAGNQPVPVEGSSTAYEVSSWPMIEFIYVPTYSAWRSPWHWGYYPSYWHPWTPLFWHEYYGYQYHWNYYYRAHYRYTPVYRFPAWRDRYYGGGLRSRSSFVETRARNGNYRQTYSRPDLAKRGANIFRREHPSAPRVNRPLPRFDNNNNNRPIVNRRDQNGNRRGNVNNTPSRPGNNDNLPGNRPVTRPARPVDANNTPNRPVSRPARPVDANNIPNRPVTRPARPIDANNTPNRPVSRPARPFDANHTPNRPVTRPANTRPLTVPNSPRSQEIRQPDSKPANPRPVREPHSNN
ncbi:MAG: hypothetical protein ABI813_09090 [Bacteroidota bacterium]